MKPPRSRLPMVKSKLPTVSGYSLAPPTKVAAKIYQTPEHRAWSDAVRARAGWRCEAIDDRGNRCTKAAPAHRMFADHIIEIFDEGQINDIANGQCLCGAHHTVKTAQARAARR